MLLYSAFFGLCAKVGYSVLSFKIFFITVCNLVFVCLLDIPERCNRNYLLGYINGQILSKGYSG